MDSKLTLPNAQQLRNIGAEIVAVGVGSNVDQIELQVSIIHTHMINMYALYVPGFI